MACQTRRNPQIDQLQTPTLTMQNHIRRVDVLVNHTLPMHPLHHPRQRQRPLQTLLQWRLAQTHDVVQRHPTSSNTNKGLPPNSLRSK